MPLTLDQIRKNIVSEQNARDSLLFKMKPPEGENGGGTLANFLLANTAAVIVSEIIRILAADPAKVEEIRQTFRPYVAPPPATASNEYRELLNEARALAGFAELIVATAKAVGFSQGANFLLNEPKAGWWRILDNWAQAIRNAITTILQVRDQAPAWLTKIRRRV